MAPISELVLRTLTCHYIYSLIRLSTKFVKKVIPFYILFILLLSTGTGKIKLGHYLSKSIQQNWEIIFPYFYFNVCEM